MKREYVVVIIRNEHFFYNIAIFIFQIIVVRFSCNSFKLITICPISLLLVRIKHFTAVIIVKCIFRIIQKFCHLKLLIRCHVSRYKQIFSKFAIQIIALILQHIKVCRKCSDKFIKLRHIIRNSTECDGISCRCKPLFRIRILHNILQACYPVIT